MCVRYYRGADPHLRAYLVRGVVMSLPRAEALRPAAPCACSGRERRDGGVNLKADADGGGGPRHSLTHSP
jgi:hypothetical protein